MSAVVPKGNTALVSVDLSLAVASAAEGWASGKAMLFLMPSMDHVSVQPKPPSELTVTVATLEPVEAGPAARQRIPETVPAHDRLKDCSALELQATPAAPLVTLGCVPIPEVALKVAHSLD